MTARATAAKLANSVPFLWVALGAVTLLAFGLLLFRRPTVTTTIISPETQATIDRLNATHARDSASLDSLRISRAAAQEHGTSLVNHGREIAERSKASQRYADSLAREARASIDTASALRFYRAAYEERTHEAADLRVAVDSLSHGADSLAKALALSKGEAILIAQRSAVKDTVIAGLLADIAKADRGCRVLWMRCPSRGTVGLVGFTVGVLAGGAVVVAATK